MGDESEQDDAGPFPAPRAADAATLGVPSIKADQAGRAPSAPAGHTLPGWSADPAAPTRPSTPSAPEPERVPSPPSTPASGGAATLPTTPPPGGATASSAGSSTAAPRPASAVELAAVRARVDRLNDVVRRIDPDAQARADSKINGRLGSLQSQVDEHQRTLRELTTLRARVEEQNRALAEVSALKAQLDEHSRTVAEIATLRQRVEEQDRALEEVASLRAQVEEQARLLAGLATVRDEVGDLAQAVSASEEREWEPPIHHLTTLAVSQRADHKALREAVEELTALVSEGLGDPSEEGSGLQELLGWKAEMAGTYRQLEARLDELTEELGSITFIEEDEEEDGEEPEDEAVDDEDAVDVEALSDELGVLSSTVEEIKGSVQALEASTTETLEAAATAASVDEVSGLVDQLREEVAAAIEGVEVIRAEMLQERDTSTSAWAEWDENDMERHREVLDRLADASDRIDELTGRFKRQSALITKVRTQLDKHQAIIDSWSE